MTNTSAPPTTKNEGDDLLVMEGERHQLMEGCRWTIKDFSKLTKKKYSEIFYHGGIGWRLLVYPKGNGVNSFSIYLDVADSEIKSQDGWCIDTQLIIIVVNQIDEELSVRKETEHRFNASERDWGFTRFMLLTELNDPQRGYLVEGNCIIEVLLTVKSVVPPKKIKNTPSVTQRLKQKDSLQFSKEPPSKSESSSAPRVLCIDSAPRVVHIDSTSSAKVTQSEEPPNQVYDVSSNEKSPAKGHVVIEENTRSEPLHTLFSHLGSLKLRNPPYSLSNGYRITKGAVLNEDMAAQLIQSALLSSELQPLVEMPAVDLASQGYYHLAKFLHYHCASIVSSQGLQNKHQEHANVLEEIKSRDLEIQKLQLSLGKYAQDLEKVKEERVKVADELSAAQEKIVNLDGELHKVKDEYSASKEKINTLEEELQLLRLENVDLQIQLEDARQAEQNA